ncbi:hypothetical protein NDU88_001600 [Pleurodeles waltl]|uniref:Uncharacterized protein n=1 Tax=Pleurodeles waltl TaxID=8319 RepID=A0AAV7WML6_PLEWA|nr:hypothetical protein NDU88_001600 [Pleurodeles waltl]
MALDRLGLWTYDAQVSVKSGRIGGCSDAGAYRAIRLLQGPWLRGWQRRNSGVAASAHRVVGFVFKHGGLRRSRSALGRFLFRFLGAWQVTVAERAAGCGCKHMDVRAAISETRGSLEDSGGCLVAPGRAGAALDP